MARLMAHRSPFPPIDASPTEVRQRLLRRLLGVRSVWFPTPAELREWDETTSPLYVRWSSATHFEIGPRLASMWAACFSPVWRGTLTGEDTTTVTWSVALPRTTVALLVGWTVVLIGWMAQLGPEIMAGDTSPMMLGFWGLLAGGTIGGPLVGARFGGEALETELPFLLDAAQTPAVEEDW